MHNKWYMLDSESVLENEMHKLLRDFAVQRITLFQPDDQTYLLSTKERELVKHENKGDINCDWRAWKGPQRLGKGAGRAKNRKTNRDHQNCKKDLKTWRDLLSLSLKWKIIRSRWCEKTRKKGNTNGKKNNSMGVLNDK